MRIGILITALLCCLASFAEQRRIVVISHRGEHLAHPENTLPAFQAAADAGADYFELDVRTTADGRLVLMHDADVARMTDGKGQVAAMTFDEIRKLKVGAMGAQVPTFDEALELASKVKIGVYVDSKRITSAGAIAAIERHDMGPHVLIYGGAGYLKEIATQRPKWKVMPEAGGPKQLQSLLELLPLQVVAFDAKDFTDETIAIARKAGVDIYVDRLWTSDNKAAWQDAVDRGATGIQTDHIKELVEYLRSKGLR